MSDAIGWPTREASNLPLELLTNDPLQGEQRIGRIASSVRQVGRVSMSVSKSQAAKALGFLAIFVVFCSAMTLQLHHWVGPWAALMVLVAASLFSIPTAWCFLGCLFASGPALEIDRFSLLDHRGSKSVSFEWTVFESARIRASIPFTHLVLRLKHPIDAMKSPRWMSFWKSFFYDAFCDGVEVHIAITNMGSPRSRAELLNEVRRFIRNSKV